jgi:sulfite exporter TauE/SafE
VELVGAPLPSLVSLQNAVKDNGYTILRGKRPGFKTRAFQKNTSQDYLQIGTILLLLLAGYQILLLFGWVPQDVAVSQNMGYGIIFLIGLMASVSSCMATAGGLLVGMTATVSQQQVTRRQKIKTSAFFNIGRVLSYTVFGALIGALGSTLTLSPRVGGIITIVASVVMLLLGVQLLNLFPWTRFLQPRMPQFLVHGLYDFRKTRSNVAPFLVGAATFFLPCGFTQALQFYVLSQKSAMSGALTMLVFALGTAPALLSLSGLTSVFTGKMQRYVMKVAGVLVLVIGLVSLNSGLSITGVSLPSPVAFLEQLGTGSQEQTGSVVATIADGTQHVSMKISYLTYAPSHITLVQGVPVEWTIDASEAKGCARVLEIPDLGLTFNLSEPSPQTIRFVPKDLGTFRFMCPMSMTTPSATLTVVSHLPQGTATPSAATSQP